MIELMITTLLDLTAILPDSLKDSLHISLDFSIDVWIIEIPLP